MGKDFVLRRTTPVTITDDDLKRLGRCVELARRALDEGNEPFGSILVAADGATLLQERNGGGGGDHTRHPEFAIARWFNGLGRNMFAISSQQLTWWWTEWGAPSSPVTLLPVKALLPDLVDGLAPQFADVMKPLYGAKFRP